MRRPIPLTRRLFLASMAGGGGFLMTARVLPRSRADRRVLHPLLEWNDDHFQLLIARTEMGQGTITALATIFADELDLPLSHVRWDHAHYEPSWPNQGTSASVSVFTEYDRYRKLGASLREWLCQHAAARWGVPISAVWTDAGAVHGREQRSLAYSTLLNRAPVRVELEEGAPRRSSGKLIGTSPRRLDSAQKIDGSALYGADIRLPGMFYAAWVFPPAGERVRSLDETAARGVPGVARILRFEDGAAVIARSTWIAHRASTPGASGSHRDSPSRFRCTS